MLFTKSLSELAKKALQKENKVKSRIQELEAEVNAFESSIQEQINLLVECELSGDVAEQENIKAKISKLRNQKVNSADLLSAYQLQRNTQLSEKESRKIKEGAEKERNARGEKVKAILEDRENVRKQIDLLQKKETELSNEYDTISNHKAEERELLNILHLIEPRTKELNHLEKDDFLRHWLGGVEGGAELFWTKKNPNTIHKGVELYEN
jgi:hypothetical protein